MAIFLVNTFVNYLIILIISTLYKYKHIAPESVKVGRGNKHWDVTHFEYKNLFFGHHLIQLISKPGVGLSPFL